MATYDRKEIPFVPVIRVSTGIDELDWLYGNTDCHWGIPMKSMSLWAGESGTGKSRTAVSICNSLAKDGHRILYFQNEMDLGSFCRKIKYDSFRVSDSIGLKDMIEDIERDRPHFVVVDSINMITEFRSGTKKDIEKIISPFREVCKTMGSHIIFLGQLNQDGTIKGSTTLPHLVDIALNLQKGEDNGLFSICVGMKHRFGRTGKSFFTIWEHTESGVNCISQSRMLDELWKKKTTHVAPRRKRLFSLFSR